MRNVMSSGVRSPPEPLLSLADVLTVTVTPALLGERLMTFAGAVSVLVKEFPPAQEDPENVLAGGLALLPVVEV